MESTPPLQWSISLSLTMSPLRWSMLVAELGGVIVGEGHEVTLVIEATVVVKVASTAESSRVQQQLLFG
jgi:hypothetical protein